MVINVQKYTLMCLLKVEKKIIHLCVCFMLSLWLCLHISLLLLFADLQISSCILPFKQTSLHVLASFQQLCFQILYVPLLTSCGVLPPQFRCYRNANLPPFSLNAITCLKYNSEFATTITHKKLNETKETQLNPQVWIDHSTVNTTVLSLIHVISPSHWL